MLHDICIQFALTGTTRLISTYDYKGLIKARTKPQMLRWNAALLVHKIWHSHWSFKLQLQLLYEHGQPPYLAQQLCPYVPTRLYALQHPNFFKFHAPTSSLARALFLYLLPLSGTHFLTVFGSVNLLSTFRKHLKTFYFKSAFPGAP